jgi:beta-glucanase (GH16 family)
MRAELPASACIARASAVAAVAALGLFACSSSGGPSTATAADASSDDGSTAYDGTSGAQPEGGASSGGNDATTDAGAGDASVDSAIPGWTLTWSDEFDGPDGSAVDPNKWSHDVGGGGWGNQEREYYTDGTQNAVVEGGNLVITATTQGASQYKCWYGTCLYTSARLITKGHFAQQYGRFEARVQMPSGQGMWPAFWLLGSNIDQVRWPACGETDIMENIGKEPSVNHGSLHAPGFPGAGLTGQYTLPGGAKFSDAFHTFAVEWDASGIRFYVDDQLYETQTPANAGSGTWAFDHPFFILLNVAVGGTWPGDPDGTTTFPQTMKVDWVRVYAKDGGDP